MSDRRSAFDSEPPDALTDVDARPNVEAQVGVVLRGKWRLESVLGVGGHAAVYAASHVNNGKRAAVKVMHPQLSMRPDLVRRMLREGFFANKVNHPCAVPVLDDDRADDGSLYLVMELLEGHSLERYVDGDQRLPPDEVIRVGLAVVDFLAVAHEQKVLHRDIKPANLFITREGAVKVLDFGIARLAEENAEGAQTTLSEAKLGTPAYMPPEQARGRWSLLDGRTDLWALGATLHALCTGRRPRIGETANEELFLAMSTPLVALRDVTPGVSEALASAIDRAVAFEMADRWPDAASMRDALRAAATRSAPPPRAVPQTPASTRTPAAPVSARLPLPPKPVPPPPGPLSPVSRPVPAPPPSRRVDLPPRAPRTGRAVSTGGAAFTAQVAWLTLAPLPDEGYVLLGVHHPVNEQPRLRAVELHGRRVLWESLHGEEWLVYVKDIRVEGDHIFLLSRFSLVAVDLATGAPRWSTTLGEKIDLVTGGVHRGPVVHEVGPPNQRLLLVKTIGRTLILLDPARGEQRLRRKFAGAVDVLPIGDGQKIVLRHDDAGRGILELVDPTTLAPVQIFGKGWFSDETSITQAWIRGDVVVAHADKWGLLASRGVVALDPITRKEIVFERERNLEASVAPVYCDSRLFFASTHLHVTSAGARNPRKAPVPLPDHRVVALAAGGPTLLAALEGATGDVSLVGLEAQALVARARYGTLAPMGPTARLTRGDPSRHVLTNGGQAYFVSRVDGADHGELRVIDLDSRGVVWTRSLADLGPLEDWYLLGNSVVLWSRTGLVVVDPSRGVVTASYGSTEHTSA